MLYSLKFSFTVRDNSQNHSNCGGTFIPGKITEGFTLSRNVADEGRKIQFPIARAFPGEF